MTKLSFILVFNYILILQLTVIGQHESIYSLEIKESFKIENGSVPLYFLGQVDSTNTFLYSNGSIVNFDQNFIPTGEKAIVTGKLINEQDWPLFVINRDSIVHVITYVYENSYQKAILNTVDLKSLRITYRQLFHIDVKNRMNYKSDITYLVSPDSSKIGFLYSIPKGRKDNLTIGLIIFNENFDEISRNEYVIPQTNHTKSNYRLYTGYTPYKAFLSNSGEVILLTSDGKSIGKTYNNGASIYSLINGKQNLIKRFEKWIYSYQNMKFSFNTERIKVTGLIKNPRDSLALFDVNRNSSDSSYLNWIKIDTVERAILMHVWDMGNSSIMVFEEGGYDYQASLRILVLKIDSSGKTEWIHTIPKNNSPYNKLTGAELIFGTLGSLVSPDLGMSIYSGGEEVDYSSFFGHQLSNRFLMIYNGNSNNLHTNKTSHDHYAFEGDGQSIILSELWQSGMVNQHVLANIKETENFRIHPFTCFAISENRIVLFATELGKIKNQRFMVLDIE